MTAEERASTAYGITFGAMAVGLSILAVVATGYASAEVANAMKGLSRFAWLCVFVCCWFWFAGMSIGVAIWIAGALSVPFLMFYAYIFRDKE